MRVNVIDPTTIDAAVIAEAAAIIRTGGLVAFPTETVYGLGADATNAAAVEGIFAAKGRPSYNPLIVHVPDAEAARAIATEWPDTARVLSARFWPGPLTVVLRKRDLIPNIVTAGLPTVAIRVPAHPVAQALLKAAERPIAAPSANPSTRLSPTDGRHVAASLSQTDGLLLDAGPVDIGIESTVIDLSSRVPTILRPGMISRSEIASLIGDVRLAADHESEEDARPSPGMMDRHYSPSARLLMTARDDDEAIETLLNGPIASGHRIAVLTRSQLSSSAAEIVTMPSSPEAYARLLYSTLHRLDDDRVDIIIVQAVPEGDAWDGIRDRLRRASTLRD
jgi:L-threonylcarbamoyladenylate synthase